MCPGERAQEVMSRAWIARVSLLVFQGGCCPSPSRGMPVHGEPGTCRNQHHPEGKVSFKTPHD